MGLLNLVFGSRGTADDLPSHTAGPHTDTVDPSIVEVNHKDTKGKASGSSTVPVTANSTLANHIHTAARQQTCTTDQPSHSPQLNASLTSKPDKSNATLSSPKRCYSPDWLLSQQHQRQQEESPFSPQDLRNRTMSSRTPSSSPPGGGVATSPDIAHCNKGKGVLFFHGHIPSSSARHPADTGAMDQEAALTHKHNLEDMALHEPLRFVNRNGLATPFFGTVFKNVIHELQELQAEGKVHGHLTPAMVKVSHEGLVMVEGAVFEATRERQYSSQAYQLGVVLHFALTGGQCPVLWAPNQLHEVLMGMDHLPTEADLIKLLLHVVVEKRPSLEDVQQHPCLWNDMQRLDLLVGLSNYLEQMGKGDVGLPSHFQHFLEQELSSAEGWQQAMHPDLMKNMTEYYKFRPDSWQELLRFVRNMHRHYRPILRKMPPALKQALGCSSDGVYRYIAPIFPKLFITSYNFVQEYCSQEIIVRAAETNFNMIRQMGMQRDTVLPGRAAARPRGGNMGPAKGHVGTTPGRVIHAPRVPPGHVQAQQASQETTEPGRQLNNHTAGTQGRGQNSQAQVTNSNQLRTHVITVPQHPRPATGGGVGRRAPAFQVHVFHGDQEMKNAIWHFNNKAKTAEAACSIARSLELSISSTATRARALGWYLKVTKLSTQGQVKQYAEQRIAELQDLIAASL
ncbi:hypothetical protein WJX82_005053 [Trebouxia sp. C0006]